MARGADREIEVDELLGATPEGLEEQIGHLWLEAHSLDVDVRLPARKMLMEKSVYYSIERLWEMGLKLEMGKSKITEKYPNHPILEGMKKLQALKDDYEGVFCKHYKWLDYLKNNTTRRLIGDKDMRAYFAKIVGYRAIPPFDEYETMKHGDKEGIIAALISEIDLHFGIYSPHIQRVFKKARIFESASGYNAAYLSHTNPEAYAKMEAEMEE